MKYTYLLINLGAISIPLIYTFYPRLRFNKTWKAFWPAALITSVLFIVWDIAYTNLGVWGFNPDYITGFYVFSLPIEELLFFVCIPYSCVFTWHCFHILIKKFPFEKVEPTVTIVLILQLVLIAAILYSRIYTSVTFVSLAMLLILLKYILKVQWLHRFYLSFAVLLIPFGVVNGMLTGTGLEAPIVWYDDTQNTGFRLLTIPVEDIFYGMLLILTNVSLYEYFKRRIYA